MYGPRPTATSSRSAVSVVPSSRVTVTPESSWVDALEPDAGLEGDLPLAERPLQELGRPRILERDQGRQRLDDGDLGAEGGPGRGELDADDAAAEDDRLLRDPLQAQRLGRR